MSDLKILVYGVSWCGDCRRTRRWLNEYGVEYQWIDIDQDKKGEEFVRKVNRGYRSVPTIVLNDGTILTEPSNAELENKLGVKERTFTPSSL